MGASHRPSLTLRSVRTSTYDDYVRRNPYGARCDTSPRRMVAEVVWTIVHPVFSRGGTYTSGTVETLIDAQTGDALGTSYRGTIAPGSGGGPVRVHLPSSPSSSPLSPSPLQSTPYRFMLDLTDET